MEWKVLKNETKQRGAFGRIKYHQTYTKQIALEGVTSTGIEMIGQAWKKGKKTGSNQAVV